MKRIRARELIKYTTDELWDILCINFIIVFDDGIEFETNAKEVLYSSYFWNFHRLYPKLPLNSRHHVRFVIKDKNITSDTHITLLGNLYFDTINYYRFYDEENRDKLQRLVYKITNDIYNDLCLRIERYVSSIDILDFLNINDIVELREHIENIEPNRESIEKCYKEIDSTIRNNKSLRNNSLAKAYLFRTVSPHQTLQCLGPRGYMTDVNSVLFPTPITSGFFNGMKNLYEMMVESRSAAKSLNQADSNISDAEYFARRLQLITMVVSKLHYVDCGSEDYITWRVQPPVTEDGREISKGDLVNLEGNFYLDENSNELKVIQKEDTHLYGKIIKLRNVLTCIHPDKSGVCAVCFGKLSDNYMPRTNLGHNCSTAMTTQSTQNTISIKHIEKNTIPDGFSIPSIGKKFITLDKNGLNIHLNKDIRVDNLKLIVQQRDAYGLTDIDLVNSVNNLSLQRTSRLSVIAFQINDNNPIVIEIGRRSRCPSLSSDFLEYAKTHRWIANDNGCFVFDFKHWDKSKKLLVVPEMEYSYTQNSKEIALLIESRIKDISDRQKPESPIRTLFELFSLVNSKLNVNLSLLSVIVYSTMIRDYQKDDYRLARNNPEASLGVARSTVVNRSLSAAYAYNDQSGTIFSPESFFCQGRPDHPLDVFIRPQEVLEARRKGLRTI